jgi:hypothetical protein
VIRTLRTALFVTVAGCGVLSACGGGSNAPAGAQRNYVPPTPAPLSSPQTVKVTITVPAPGTSGVRRTSSISSGTKSVTVLLAAVNGQNVPPQKAAVINVASGSANCTAAPNGTTCTGTVPGAIGVDAFTVTLYSGPNGGGQVLATGTITAPISTSTPSLTVTNTVAISLVPIVSSLQMVVTPSILQPGTPADGTIDVQPVDATGAVIFGAQGTVALSMAGTENSVTFDDTGMPATTVALYRTTKFHYSGSTFIQSPVVITGVLTGSSPQLSATVNLPVNFPPTPTPSPTPTGLVDSIYVLNTGANAGNGATVTVYPVASNGNATPIRTLQLNANKAALSMAVDSGGNLYVGYNDGSIEQFAYNANGNATPTSLFSGDPNTSTAIDPLAVAIGPNNTIATVGQTAANGMDPNGYAALVFPDNASGTVAPLNAWNFKNPPQISLQGICSCSVAAMALDATGNFYVAGALKQTLLSSTPGIYIAAANSTGPNAVQSRTISGSATTIPSTPFAGTIAGLAVDPAGKIYESQYVGSGATLTGAINVFNAGTSGGVTNVAPTLTITGTPVNIVVGQNVPALPIAVNSSDIFAANGSTNSVLVYAASGGSPLQTITGGNTGLNGPSSIAVGLSGPGGNSALAPKEGRPVSAGMSQRFRGAATTNTLRFERRGP